MRFNAYATGLHAPDADFQLLVDQRDHEVPIIELGSGALRWRGCRCQADRATCLGWAANLGWAAKLWLLRLGHRFAKRRKVVAEQHVVCPVLATILEHDLSNVVRVRVDEQLVDRAHHTPGGI